MEIISFDFERKLLNDFIEFGFKIYKNDKKWITPIKEKIKKQLSKTNNFFSYGKIKNFILKDQNKISARISAIINDKAKSDKKQIGYLGFFESKNNFEYAKKILNNSLEYLKKQGIKSVYAPINFSTWNKYRFLTKGFEGSPFFLEPFNPDYYPDFFEKYGFKKIKTYYSNLINNLDKEIARYKKIKERFFNRGYYIRKIDFNNIEEELKLLYELTINIFQENWGYTEITIDEFINLYKGIDKLVDADCLLFAHNPGKKPIGFLFGMPDYSTAIKKMKGKNNIISKFNFLLNKNKSDIFILKTIGVLPDARSSGVGASLITVMHEYAVRKKYKKAIHALMIEDNASRTYSKDNPIIKEYGLYKLDI